MTERISSRPPASAHKTTPVNPVLAAATHRRILDVASILSRRLKEGEHIFTQTDWDKFTDHEIAEGISIAVCNPSGGSGLAIRYDLIDRAIGMLAEYAYTGKAFKVLQRLINMEGGVDVKSDNRSALVKSFVEQLLSRL